MTLTPRVALRLQNTRLRAVFYINKQLLSGFDNNKVLAVFTLKSRVFI